MNSIARCYLKSITYITSLYWPTIKPAKITSSALAILQATFLLPAGISTVSVSHPPQRLFSEEYHIMDGIINMIRDQARKKSQPGTTTPSK